MSVGSYDSIRGRKTAVTQKKNQKICVGDKVGCLEYNIKTVEWRRQIKYVCLILFWTHRC